MRSCVPRPLLVWLLLGTAACQGQESRSTAVLQPDLVQEMPKALREVSGLCFVEEQVVACVQDEDGALFFWDLATGKVRERAPFGAAGDYEGIARIGASYWVLRSDGTLLALARKKAKYEIRDRITPSGEFREFESLCADVTGTRLLLAPKRLRPAKGEHEVPVFVVDLTRREVAPEPLFVLARRELVAAATRLGAALPTKTTKDGRSEDAFEGVISELAVHPSSGEILALCPKDDGILVLSARGELLQVLHYDARLLPQAEAMTFLPNGDLVVASEGRDGPARIAVFGAAKLARAPAARTTSRPASTGGGR